MEENERQSNGGLLVLFIIIIITILMLSGFVGLLLFGDDLGIRLFSPEETTAPTTEAATTAAVTTEPPTTEAEWEVPDVVGMYANDAYAELHRAGTRFEITRQYNAMVETDYVISQWPEAGTIIKDSEKVQLVISKGVDRPDTTPAATTAPATPAAKSTDTTQSTQSSKSSAGDYILDGSDKRYVSFNEIAPLNEQELTLALNEIYARKGRRFNSPELQAYFDSKSWYKGTIEPSDFDEGSLNKYEDANVRMIVAVMSERGYR